MKKKVVLAIFAWCAVSFFLSARALAQGSPCLPATQQIPQAILPTAPGTSIPLAQPPRNVTISAIPGIVAAGVQWTKVWQTGGNSADGIIADKDGSV